MKIILNDKVVEKVVPESLPMLIHGAEGSGASLYTIALAAKFYQEGYAIVFLCGYPMAEEEFKKITGDSNAKFFTKDKQAEFKYELGSSALSKTIVFIKNVELFQDDILGAIGNQKNIVLSGNVLDSSLTDKILSKEYTTKVYFSDIKDVKLPKLNKYEGWVVSGDFQGVTKLEKAT